jgi:hypothetical protein
VVFPIPPRQGELQARDALDGALDLDIEASEERLPAVVEILIGTQRYQPPRRWLLRDVPGFGSDVDVPIAWELTGWAAAMPASSSAASALLRITASREESLPSSPEGYHGRAPSAWKVALQGELRVSYGATQNVSG